MENSLLGYKLFAAAVIGDSTFVQAELSEEQQNALIKICDELINKLVDSHESDIIRRSFGVNTKQQKLRAIGSHLNISVDHVRQIESRAFKKVRHISRSQRLRDFLAGLGFPARTSLS